MKKRGFSFEFKKFLNMQMGINKYSAYDVVNTLDKENLAKLNKSFRRRKRWKNNSKCN